jgi:hypothetical protein
MTHTIAYYVMLLASTTPTPVTPTGDAGVDIVRVVLTSVISTAVIGTIITATVQYFINRRNSRVTERKNTVDAESDIIVRYKEAAAEERAQKESAVQTVRNLLAIAEEQVISLKSTVLALNATITNMNAMASTQIEVIEQLTTERDRSMSALTTAEQQIEAQKIELARHQQEILELTYPKAEIDEIRNGLTK